ncbi:MAG: molybdopterin-dependent oxidoreductase [Chloroflexota bacterium]
MKIPDWRKGGEAQTTKLPALAPDPHATGELASYPPPDQWDDWVEYESMAWPRRMERHFSVVPTVCFNCEAACGLLAYIDKESGEIRKLEGNPIHPASRGRNCAKGPATLNQVYDPERILYPLKRTGKRGEGKWERVSWDEVLDDIAGRMRQALVEDRKNEIMYHVGRHGEDGYTERVVQAWGVDGVNTHTNICSSGGRTGYAFWMGYDRPSPDHANARFILLISAHLESGHYFNPHAQRIVEAQMKGAKIAVLDPRLSNTASRADYWLPTWPGSEAAVLLAMANVILQEDLYDREFLRRWTNWGEFLHHEHPDLSSSVDSFIAVLKQEYARYTPEFAEQESGVPAAQIVEVAREAGKAGSALSTHIWRAAAAGNLGGWRVTRALFFLNVLTGSVGTVGGTSPNLWDKYIPQPFSHPTPIQVWNELLWPPEYPLAHMEMSFLLPYFLKEGRGKLAMYFTRVYNPVWTNPDGMSWVEALRDETKVECHAALTPIWNETCNWADYVLPMGHAPERHDTHSYETQAGRWLGFRQPVLRVAKERAGEKIEFTYQANPGEVWEENEFWIELSWRVDADGSLGIRQHFESPYRPGKKITVEEYYRWIFENSVPGLPEKAAAENLTPLEYMRKYAAVTIDPKVYNLHERVLTGEELDGAVGDLETGIITTQKPPPHTTEVVLLKGAPVKGKGRVIGVEVDGVPRAGFPTPSGRLEFYSPTLKHWGWPGDAIPTYTHSHVHHSTIDRESGEFALLPTFRLPTLIHTRSGNAKWLNEISHSNPVWIHPEDAARVGVDTPELVRVTTDTGYFVAKCWVTEGTRPGVVLCSHHLGRWRLHEDTGEGWSSALVDLQELGPGQWRMRQIHGVRPFKSGDPDSQRVWWDDAGVHQNLTFPPHPDPISGMHAWHQKVRVEKARSDDQYGDIVVDTNRSYEIYREWLGMTKPAPGPDNMRRPYWLQRPSRPAPDVFSFGETDAGGALDGAAPPSVPTVGTDG